MSDIHHAFVSAFSHKRKRSRTDVSDEQSANISKRRITSLPIRSPTSQRTHFFGPSPFGSLTGELTPVETSEDELVSRGHNGNDIWSSSNRPPSLTESQTSSESSASSVKVHISDQDEDQDMEMMPSSPTRPRIGRARSNDILPSALRSARPHLLSAGSAQYVTSDRIPTPIHSHFDTRINDLPSAPRHQFPPLRTNLSPMMEQDGFTPLCGLPTPGTDTMEPSHGQDEMMSFERTSSSMSDLRVRDEDDMMDDVHIVDDEHYGQDLGPGGHSSQGGPRWREEANGRTARLHMGYMPGCAKCAQKVPGHYSHILWS